MSKKEQKPLLTQEELDLFNVDLQAVCEKHGINLTAEMQPKLVVTRK